MTILQINVVYDEKSTGRTCKETELFLSNHGIQCYTAYGVGKKRAAEKAYLIDTKLEYLIHNVLSRLTGLEGYYSRFATVRLIKYIKRIRPDVVHLHNLHGHYLNLPKLFAYLKKSRIPIVFTLHDCWMLTGKCTHPVRPECTKWMYQCEHCPEKGEYPESLIFDFSKKMHKDKTSWFKGLNIKCVVGVSAWSAQQARMSFLKEHNICYIYNWIDFTIFHPFVTKEVFDRFGISKYKFTVICVAAAWKEGSRKNNELMEFAKQIGDEAQIVVVGRNASSISGENVFSTGYVSNTTVLAQLYSSADVYVHLSSADTFGKVIAEAMACGTPAVAYDCTACSELVEPKCGVLVPLHDTTALAKAVREIMANGKDYYKENCIQRVMKDFDYQRNCEALLDLYKDACDVSVDK